MNCILNHGHNTKNDKDYEETIKWCEKIISDYPQDQLEALIMLGSCYYFLGNIHSCFAYIAKAWDINNYQLDENLLKDKRFTDMFAYLKELFKNYNINEK